MISGLFIYRVNSQSSVVRSITEVKKKWADVKSSSKAKEAKQRRELKSTGGGDAPADISLVQKKVSVYIL